MSLHRPYSEGPAKFSQPLADLRPYVNVEKDGSADVTDFKVRRRSTGANSTPDFESTWLSNFDCEKG